MSITNSEVTDGNNRPRNLTVETFEELSKLALNQLKKNNDWVIVCGPISTGGLGSAQLNLRIISIMITHLRSCELRVFDQLRFESSLWALSDKWKKDGNSGYCMPILEEFYLPIYTSGFISTGYFLPGWKSSFGARWERKKFIEVGIKIIDLPTTFVENHISKIH